MKKKNLKKDKLGNKIRKSVIKEIVKQKRPGGLLDK